jgi:hypothetical protein
MLEADPHVDESILFALGSASDNLLKLGLSARQTPMDPDPNEVPNWVFYAAFPSSGPFFVFLLFLKSIL